MRGVGTVKMGAMTLASRPSALPDGGDAARPLDLPRLVMRRAAVVVLLGVLLLTVLGLARMRDTVADELAGARMLAQLAQRLSALQTLPDDAARQSLRQWREEGSLRHLRVRVVDAAGAVMVDDLPEQRLTAPMRWLASAGVALFDPGPSFTVAWPLARPSGDAWQVTLTAVPESERVEALTSLLEGVALLAGVGLLMLVVMAWNTRLAFRPMSRLLAAIADLEHAPALEGGPARALSLPAMPIAELETVASALRRLDAALAAAEQHRRALGQKVLTLQEDERVHLARELHDELGQRLTALRFDAVWLQRQLQAHPEWHNVVQGMVDRCAEVQQDVRKLLGRLRPLGPADEQEMPVSLTQLAGLIHDLVQGWRDTAALGGITDYQLQVSLQLPGRAEERAPTTATDDCWLSRDLALVVYRLTQEALTNSARHAQATQVAVAVLVTVQGEQAALHWCVADDGRGLAQPELALRKGNGLGGMQERVWALGGTWAMASENGLRLQASFTYVPPSRPATSGGAA